MKEYSEEAFRAKVSTKAGRSEAESTKAVRRRLLDLFATGGSAVLGEESNGLRTAEERTKTLRATFARVAKDEGLAFAYTWAEDGQSFRIDKVVSR
jgi:hypothetical protein